MLDNRKLHLKNSKILKKKKKEIIIFLDKEYDNFETRGKNWSIWER